MSRHSYIYNYLFTPSGDLTEKALIGYAFNELAEKERTAADVHLAECEMCRDAVEGIALFPSEEAYKAAVAGLDEKVKDRAEETERGARGFVMYRRLAVAASVLLFIGIAFFWVNKQINTNSDLAMGNEEVTKATEPSVQVVPESTIAPGETSATQDASGKQGALQLSKQDQPYTYNWQPGRSDTISANGLASGTYTVTVTDANGDAMTTREGYATDAEVDEYRPVMADSISLERSADMQTFSNAGSNWDGDSKGKKQEQEKEQKNKDDRKKSQKSTVTEGNVLQETPEAITYSEPTAPGYNYNQADDKSAEETLELQQELDAIRGPEQSADHAPIYKEGEGALKAYLAGAKVPASLSGKDSIKIELNIDAKGKVEKVQILSGIADKKQADALKAYLLKMPAWQPATYNGIAVKSKRIVIIRY